MQHIGDIIASKVCGQNDEVIHTMHCSLITAKQLGKKILPSGQNVHHLDGFLWGVINHNKIASHMWMNQIRVCKVVGHSCIDKRLSSN